MKEVSYERFTQIMTEYNYKQGTIDDLWDVVKGTGATEEKIRNTCENMRPALELMDKARRGDLGAVSKMAQDMKEMTKPIGKEGFFRECLKCGLPEECAKDLWERHPDISEKDLKITLLKMINDPEVGPAMRILAGINKFTTRGKKESIKKDLKKESKWFQPTEAQKN